MNESETPRTDASDRYRMTEGGITEDANGWLIETAFARQLETELAASHAREDKLAAALQSVNQRLENGDDIMVQTTPWRVTTDLIDDALATWRATK